MSDYYRWPIPDAALAVHMAVTGSGDWGDADAMAAFLRMRLADWKPSMKGADRFDDAVRAMAQAALGEYDETRSDAAE